MLSTHEIIKYMLARRIEGTDEIAADQYDPVMLQAWDDGYAYRLDGVWYGRGEIQPGERRTIRFIEGGTEVIQG